MKKLVLKTLLCISFAASASPTYSQSEADQQQKDLDTKKQIYGVKHPWENTLPYGTQFTPPQSGVNSSESAQPTEHSNSDKPSAVETKKKSKKGTKGKTAKSVKHARLDSSKSSSAKKTIKKQS